MRAVTKTDRFEFLPAALEVLETPPRPAARLVALAICTFAVIALIWSIVGFIDTVAVAQGQVVPSERVKVIQPLENGLIRKIHVKDGDAVRAGDPLVTLDPTDSQSGVDELRAEMLKARLDAATTAARLTDNPEKELAIPEGATGALMEASISEMRSAIERHNAQLLAVEAELNEQRAVLADFENQRKKLRATLPMVESRLADLNYLADRQLARRTDLLQARTQRIDMTSQILSAESGIEQSQARITARERRRAEIVANYRSEALQKRSEALRQIASFEQRLVREEQRNRNRVMKAPIDGTVIGQAVFTESGVVTTKDTLMRIVPANSTLVVEALVLNKDIGFVAEGQRVEVKLETFPFTRYGLVHGKVIQLWRDAIQDEKRGLVYKAEIALDEHRIRVGSAWQPITPGMSVQAEIQTGKRRAIDYFLSPLLRYRDESLKER